MAYQQREGQGSLFKNDKTNDRQPDFKGSIMIKGVLYNVSAWNRTSAGGREYISLQADERTNDGQQNYGGQPNYGGGQQQGYAPRQQQPAYAAPAQPSYAAPAPAYESAPQMDIPAPGLEDLPIDDLPF